MCMQDVTFPRQPSLPSSQIAALRLAASTRRGPKRRSLEAEMTLTDGDGKPLKAKAGFAWGRQSVALGLAEARSGLSCLGGRSAFRGGKRGAAYPPQAAQALG